MIKIGIYKQSVVIINDGKNNKIKRIERKKYEEDKKAREL